jgi:hypothetical protein
VTAVFDALRSSVPKLRYRPSPESIELSSLGFASARPGSVSIALHIPNERLLAGQSQLDETFAKVFEVLSTRHQDGFRNLVSSIGVASISKAFAWAEVSALYGLDTSIRWGKAVQASHKLTISHSDAVYMRDSIEATSDESEEDLWLECILEGIDPVLPYFHIIRHDGTSISGKTSPDFPHTQWTTRRAYVANLTRRSTVKFATGEERTIWTLKQLIDPEA